MRESCQMTHGWETWLCCLEKCKIRYSHHSRLQVWKEVMAQRLRAESPSSPLLCLVTLNRLPECRLLCPHLLNEDKNSDLAKNSKCSDKHSLILSLKWCGESKNSIKLGEAWMQTEEHSGRPKLTWTSEGVSARGRHQGFVTCLRAIVPPRDRGVTCGIINFWEDQCFFGLLICGLCYCKVILQIQLFPCSFTEYIQKSLE